MKIKNLLTKASDELKSEKEEQAVELLKNSIKNIESCKKALAQLEDKHKELLDTDLDSIEDDDLEY